MDPNQNNNPFATNQFPKTNTENLPDLGPKNFEVPSTTRSVAVKNEATKPVSEEQPASTVIPTVETTDPAVQPNVNFQPNPVPNQWQAPVIQPQDSEVFTNQVPTPQPDPTPQGSGTYVTSSNPLGLQPEFNEEILPNNTNPLHSIPINKPILFIIVATIFVLGLGGFLVNEFVLNRISSLKLVSNDAQFYLSLSVKQNPQAKKAKTLIGKFPGGERILKEFDKYYAQYIGGADDPLSNISFYANSELLLSRISRAENKFDTTNRLFTIVDTESSKKANEGIGDFEDDKAQYQTTTNTYKGSKILSIKQKSEVELYNKNLGRKSYLEDSLSTPKPKSLFVTNIDKFIVASDKESDVQKAVALSQTRKFLGFGKGDDPKSVLDSNDHKDLSAFFQKETFLKFFQRDPITPYNLATPYYYSSVSTYPDSPESEARTFQKLSRAVDVSIAEDGAKINSYTLDLPDTDVKTNSFKLSDSLASKLPKKFSGVAPTFYSETKNIKQQYQSQMELAEKMKDSKNRTQREAFADYLKNLDKMKDSYKKTYGIDYEDDVINWLDGNTALIVNAGNAKKPPEFIVVAETKEQKKIEASFKKLKIPNYAQEANDATRKSDLREIASALANYYFTFQLYPSSLNELTTTKNPRSFSKTNSYFLKTLPKDPTTGANYSYTPIFNKTDYILSSQLEDGQTYTLSSDNYYTGEYTGKKKENKISPESTDYKGTKIYSMNLYNYNDSKFYFYFAVAKDKTILSFSDSDKSVKEIIDFKGGDSLTKNAAWKKQFSKIDSVSDVSFIEPINLWGFVEYLQNVYPEYKDTASSYSGTQKTYFEDMEKVVKGYLQTVPSIGSVTSRKGKVLTISGFVNVVELPKKDKQNVEDALDRLMNLDESRESSDTTYKSVLGVNTQSLTEKARSDWDNFYKLTLKQIIDPESILSN